MKKKLALLPVLGLILSGCSLQDVKAWVRDNIVNKVKNIVSPEEQKEDGKKEDQKEDEKHDETPELPAEYSLMKNWAANPSEEVYNVLETETETKIAYTDAVGEKAGGWEYVARSFAFDAQYIERFNEYKKITGSSPASLDYKIIKDGPMNNAVKDLRKRMQQEAKAKGVKTKWF